VDQTITLLWFEDEEVPQERRRVEDSTEQDTDLEELDGVLRFKDKRGPANEFRRMYTESCDSYRRSESALTATDSFTSAMRAPGALANH